MRIIPTREIRHAGGLARCISPLRWPGGKTMAIRHIAPFIPDGVTTMASPFMGGGSLEIAVALSGVRIHGYDLDPRLVAFWQQTLNNPSPIARAARLVCPATEEVFSQAKRILGSQSATPLETATALYVANRTSRGGNILNGGFHKINDRFGEGCISRLERFACPGLTVSQSDFRDSIPRHSSDFLYLDPPYFGISPIYSGHNGFPHAELANLLRRRDGWILSYDDCPGVRRLYDGFRIIPLHWGYSLSSKRDSSGKDSSEVLILSNDLKIP